MKNVTGLIVLFFVLTVPAAFCVADTGAGPEPATSKHVSFMPQWIPQAQFAGYYTAFEKGFYKTEGLDVEMVQGGPDKPSAEWLKNGTVDFTTMFLSTAISERAKGTRLINLCQIVFKSSQTLIAKKSSGIKTLQDMNGKKVGMWGPNSNILPLALFRTNGVKIVSVPQYSSVDLFLSGGVDVVSAMWYNEYHLILDAGVKADDLTVIHLSDFGASFPEDGIYCMEDTIRKDPQTCCRFVMASIQGWRYAFEHPDEALDIVMKYVKEAKVDTSREHQRWMLEHMREVIDLPGDQGGRVLLNREGYMTVANGLKALGIIKDIPAFSEFFTNCGAVDER